MEMQNNYVHQRFPSKEIVHYLEAVLEVAKDERPLQAAIASNPCLLRCLSQNTRHFWAFDRPSFGGELIPDFLTCTRTSAGYSWVYVELESPTKSPLIKTGLASNKLRDAIGQIDDWRIWLRENIAYAQNHLGFKEINAECDAYILIGRRNMIDPKFSLKYRELSKNSLNIISYDRFIEMIEI